MLHIYTKALVNIWQVQLIVVVRLRSLLIASSYVISAIKLHFLSVKCFSSNTHCHISTINVNSYLPGQRCHPRQHDSVFRRRPRFSVGDTVTNVNFKLKKNYQLLLGITKTNLLSNHFDSILSCITHNVTMTRA